ncbi:MAG: DUF488 domain-containing protein [candidate division KSB1 bacterium]|nr:DUF488 domain-containing protein [candidate division KSB1 bacterium]MDQ7063321.1 DUF488 domain-containing protein [candidate division KSB1 bacterium]
MQTKHFRLYSIGHGSDTPEHFLQRLQTFGITCVADVRRFPHTARLSHFKDKSLRLLLERAGIDYVPLGEWLGGFRKEGYESYTRTPEFSEGLQKLMALAEDQNVAFLCAEFDPLHCHRRFIAAELVKQRWPVAHILKDGSLISHSDLIHGQTLDLFDPTNGF